MGGKWLATVVMAVSLLAGGGAAASSIPGLPTQALCAAETAKAERLYGIPSQLLDAISLVESGRYDSESRAVLAWPWTVMAEGEGRYFPNKAAAVAEVKKLKARGVKNIDVGCMQVNLMYHGQAFPSLDDAFEPSSNVGYAARFLRGLYDSTSHWPTAASYYHSQTPHLAATYKSKLMKVWSSGGSREAIASLRPVGPGHPQLAALPPSDKPRPSISQRVEQAREAWRASRGEVQQEASAIANAYRQARLVEYKMRRARMEELRQALR
ncbi:transglycosylase SLT domain-containing protein [Magnetospirillum aberrantis]|nr:transglycosylase SLT domain-containing protein [Magnetospirillum aberrantis]